MTFAHTCTDFAATMLTPTSAITSEPIVPSRAIPVFNLVDRSIIRGTFSLIADGPVSFNAEPGLVIRVHAGCLWIPGHQNAPAVAVAAGEQFVAPSAGRLTVRASRRTQVELEWPSHTQA